jgi:hypothetical protein
VSPRAPALVGAALLVAAALMAAGQARLTGSSQGAAVAIGRAAAAPAPSAAGASAPARLQPSPPAGSSPIDRSIEGWLATLPASAAPVPPGHVELCGLGSAAEGSHAAAQLEARATVAHERGLRRLHAAAIAHPEPVVRAAALMASLDVVPLVAMATITQDATVYAMAMQVCSRALYDSSPHCGRLTPEQWARLDPDNGIPWVSVFNAAQMRGDAAAQDEALYRASLATQWSGRAMRFAGLAVDLLATNPDPTERMLALVTVVGVQAALSLPAYQHVMKHCAAGGDAHRQQACDRIARLMVNQGELQLDVALGRRIGESAGWPVHEVERVSARLHGHSIAMQVAIDPMPKNGILSCDGLRAGLRWAVGSATIGERAWGERELQRLGLGDDELLRRWHAIERAKAASAPQR